MAPRSVVYEDQKSGPIRFPCNTAVSHIPKRPAGIVPINRTFISKTAFGSKGLDFSANQQSTKNRICAICKK